MRFLCYSPALCIQFNRFQSEGRVKCMEGKKRHFSMHTSLFLYVGNFILFCKLCHYIMQIVIQ